MSTGYKSMLRDRLPDTVDMALKWCKAKERWITHVYNAFIGVYTEKTERHNATRIVLGLSKKMPRTFNFHKSIDWDNITEEERDLWKSVESWVMWFRTMYLYIENDYKISLAIGKSESEIKEELLSKHLQQVDPEQQEKLADFLIDNLKE